jgi:plastocyanin
MPEMGAPVRWKSGEAREFCQNVDRRGTPSACLANAMKSAILPLVLLALGGPCATAMAEATVEGHVDLPKAHSAPVVAKRYEIVAKGGVVATDPPMAVVYLEGPFSKPTTIATAQMAQKDLSFVTPLLPVAVGTKVEFPNQDDTFHNIFSYSQPKRFDLGRYRSDERPIPFEIFDQAGLVTLHCDIHEHMRGLVLVVPTPYFIKSDTAGKFRLTGLPAGHYSLKAWVSSKSTLEKPVELKSGATVHVDFP